MQNVNSPVMDGYLKIATKFNVQDISYRAMAGRLKKVSGIEITPTELMISMSDEAENMSAKSYKKVAKIEKWTIKQAGNVVHELASLARPHIIYMLQMHLLGFIPKEVLTKKVKVTQAMTREGGGIAIPDWSYVVNEIEKHQAPKPRAKRVPESKVSDNDNVELGYAHLPISEMVKLGLNFKKIQSNHHVAMLLDAPTDVKGLKALGKTLIKSESNGIKFEPQFKGLVQDLDKDGSHQLYLSFIKTSQDDEMDDEEILFSIDLQGNVSIS